MSINTYNEKSLHRDLKQWCAQPGDRFEVPVSGFIVDIFRDNLLIEIQTSGLGKLKRKLGVLTREHQVRLIHPIAAEKWIVKPGQCQDGSTSRRKSPKRGRMVDLFAELVSIPHLIDEPNFSLEIVLVQEEEVRQHTPGKNWRRKGWGTAERRLLRVLNNRTFASAADVAMLLPEALVEPFSTSDLAEALACQRRLAQQMSYCLRKMAAITMVGKQGNAHTYRRAA